MPAERADRVVADLPTGVVYAGTSWGRPRTGALDADDPDAAALVLKRSTEFLARLG